MAIKIIDEIPITSKGKARRELIREDIQEAIDKGISLFEFEGDYNYKTLAQNARDVAKSFKAKKLIEVQRKFKEENLTDDEKNIKGFYVWFKSVWEYKHHWIHITSCKGEDNPRVFCKIDDVKNFEQVIIEDCKKVLAEARTDYVLIDGKWINRRRIRNPR